MERDARGRSLALTPRQPRLAGTVTAGTSGPASAAKAQRAQRLAKVLWWDFRGFRELAPQSAAEYDAKLVPRFARTTSPPAPTTWLLGKGWLEHGRISIHQAPCSRG
jgi:hypothetical protein